MGKIEKTDKNRIPWQYLEEFRGKDFTGEWPTFPELLSIQVKRFPDSPFFIDFDGPHNSKRSFSYKDVFNHVEKLGKWLIENGLKKGDKVAVMGKNSPEWGIVYLATLYASGIIVPVDNGLNEKEVANIVNVAEPVFVFCDDDRTQYYENNFPKLKIYSLNPENQKFACNLQATKEVEWNDPAKENDTAAILFTSGTTGTPKGVMLSHKNLIADGFIAQRNFTTYHTDVFYALLPIHHAYTMQAAFINPLEAGASIVFGKSLAVTRMLRELKEGKITIMLGVPILYNKLLAGIRKGIKAKGPIVGFALAIARAISFTAKRLFKRNIGKKLFKPVLEQASIYTIRVAISGGGPLAASVCKMYNAMGIDFIQGYGLTETAPILALNPVDHFKIESVGKTFAPYEDIKIIDTDADQAKKGLPVIGNIHKIGEIVVKGPMVMQGYYKMPEETAAMFTEDGYLKTGDLGWIDNEGYIMLCGRAKNLIVTSGGKNVYPEELEDAFQLYDDVKQVTVRGYYKDGDKTSEEIEALIYPSDELFERLGITRDNNFVHEEVLEIIQKIVSKVNKTLPPYAVITKISILKKPLEMTTSQKVKRNFTPEIYEM